MALENFVVDPHGPLERAVPVRLPLTIKGLIAALVECDDHSAIPEFTFDGETYFHIYGVDAGEAVTLDVEPGLPITSDRAGGNGERK